MVKVRNLSKTFYSGICKRHAHRAVDNVSFSIDRGKTLGLVGESGCGKSTLARCILRLIPVDEGEMLLGDTSVFDAKDEEMPGIRQRMQIVFQHPYSALDPGRTIIESVEEPMKIHKLYTPQDRSWKILRIFKKLNLHTEIFDRYPHQVSGGQLQRVVIARALTLDPEFIIFDEPTSMLDISVQATILHLLKELQEEYELTYLFISHDIEVVRFMCDEIFSMKKGAVSLVRSDRKHGRRI